MGSAILFFFDFRCFCMVCSRWPESRKSKKTKKTKLQTTCPQSQTRAPMGSAIFAFLFFWIFEVFAWSAPDGQNLENQKKPADHMSTESDKSPNGICSFCFFVFFDFRGFCMVCSRWPEPRKSKKKQKKQNCKTTCPQSQTRAPMGSAVLDFLLFF